MRWIGRLLDHHATVQLFARSVHRVNSYDASGWVDCFFVGGIFVSGWHLSWVVRRDGERRIERRTVHSDNAASISGGDFAR